MTPAHEYPAASKYASKTTQDLRLPCSEATTTCWTSVKILNSRWGKWKEVGRWGLLPIAAIWSVITLTSTRQNTHVQSLGPQRTLQTKKRAAPAVPLLTAIYIYLASFKHHTYFHSTTDRIGNQHFWHKEKLCTAKVSVTQLLIENTPNWHQPMSSWVLSDTTHT